MKNLLSYAGLMLLGILIFGCKEKGCTDPNAINYNESAKKDDNSCTYQSLPISDEVTINSNPTFKMVIDGETHKMPSGNNSEVSYVTYFSNETSPIEIYKSGGYYVNSNTDEIYLGIYHYMSGSSTAGQVPEYNSSMFSPGVKDFYADAEINDIDDHYEVVVYLNNAFYSSRIKNDQSSNNFTVLESVDTLYNGVEMVKMLVELNCMLYNMDNPNDFKFISEANAILLIEK